MMWIVFGGIAIVLTIVNLYMYFVGKDYKLPMALALSFTALTLCAENSLVAGWVKASDWVALEDVVPYIETPLWALTIIAIILNITPILLDMRKKKN